MREPDQTRFEDVQFLTGSPQRFAVLAALAESGARPTDLCDRVDATRTTIQRILAGFSERQWVHKQDREYRLTVAGRRVFERYEQLLAELQRADELGPLATHLGRIGETLPARAFASGDVTISTAQNPLAAFTRLTARFGNAEGEILALSPIVAESFNEIGAKMLEDERTTIEFIIDRGVLERSATDFSTELERGLEDESISMFVHEDPLTFGLLVDDCGCCLAAYDGENNLRGVLESTDEVVVEWAIEQFERYRERSTPLEAVLTDGDLG